jgi:hypothetical protein
MRPNRVAPRAANGNTPPSIQSIVNARNRAHLRSAPGYLTPADKLTGLAQGIFAQRDRKLEAARPRRHEARQAMRKVA